MTQISTDSSSHALFRALPAAAEAFPRALFGEWPTPVDKVDVQTSRGMQSVWIKRDDVSGVEYGGNKVRKLEFLLGDAVASGHHGVWTLGAIGSHHCLATAIYGRACGLDVHVLHVPQPVSGHVRRNIRALLAAGGQPRLASRTALPVELLRGRVKQWFTKASERDYRMPSGGSSPVGCLGFVNAAFELAEQVESGVLPRPRRIYVAAGTCGTICGLQVGLGLAGLSDVEIVGIRVIDRVLCNGARIKLLSGHVAELLEKAGVSIDRSTWPAVRLVHDHFGAEYGRPTDAARQAMARMKDAGGPPLEFTYTGKAFAGLLADAEVADLSDVLFWNTFNSGDINPLADAVEISAVPDEYRAFFDGPPELED